MTYVNGFPTQTYNILNLDRKGSIMVDATNNNVVKCKPATTDDAFKFTVETNGTTVRIQNVATGLYLALGQDNFDREAVIAQKDTYDWSVTIAESAAVWRIGDSSSNNWWCNPVDAGAEIWTQSDTGNRPDMRWQVYLA